MHLPRSKVLTSDWLEVILGAIQQYRSSPDKMGVKNYKLKNHQMPNSDMIQYLARRTLFLGTTLEFAEGSLNCRACWQLGRWVLFGFLFVWEDEFWGLCWQINTYMWLISRGQSAALLHDKGFKEYSRALSIRVPLWDFPFADHTSLCKLVFSRWHTTNLWDSAGLIQTMNSKFTIAKICSLTFS